VGCDDKIDQIFGCIVSCDTYTATVYTPLIKISGLFEFVIHVYCDT